MVDNGSNLLSDLLDPSSYNKFHHLDPISNVYPMLV